MTTIQSILSTTDHHSGWFYIAAGNTVTIDFYKQMTCFGVLTVDGILDINGVLISEP